MYARHATRLSQIGEAISATLNASSPKHTAFINVVLASITSADFWRGESEEGGGTFEGPDWGVPTDENAPKIPPDIQKLMDTMCNTDMKDPEDEEYDAPMVDWGGPKSRACARLCRRAQVHLYGWNVWECE